jgi:hypothetical protein
MTTTESETLISSNHPLALRSKEEVQRHARERLKQFEDERRMAAAERRYGRLRGELSQSLGEKLESCNPLQLRTVIRLAHKFQELHRKPPSLNKCRMKYTEDVLKFVDVRNQRFTLELRRSSQRGDRVYVNGPYVVSHWRDGSITRHKYFGNKNLRKRVPRKVWDGFRELLESPETTSRLKHLNEQWTSRPAGELNAKSEMRVL